MRERNTWSQIGNLMRPPPILFFFFFGTWQTCLMIGCLSAYIILRERVCEGKKGQGVKMRLVIEAESIIYGQERERDLSHGETLWDAEPQASLWRPIKSLGCSHISDMRSSFLKLTSPSTLNPCPAAKLLPRRKKCSENKVFFFCSGCHLASIFHMCSPPAWDACCRPSSSHPPFASRRLLCFAFLSLCLLEFCLFYFCCLCVFSFRSVHTDILVQSGGAWGFWRGSGGGRCISLTFFLMICLFLSVSCVFLLLLFQFFDFCIVNMFCFLSFHSVFFLPFSTYRWNGPC